MNKNLDFDFCIITNPFSNGNRNIIFITKSGIDFLDYKISDSKEYKYIKEVLEKFGYTETNELQFESSNNHNSKESTIIAVRLFLEGCGLFYGRKLEVNMVKNLNKIKKTNDNNNFIYKKNELIKSNNDLFKFKYNEPKLKEKITLSFYLFLEFGFNQEGRPMIQFGGDFNNSKDKGDRNYIKIASSEFERIQDSNKPNSFIFLSIKKQSDFIKEVGILYSGYFKYQEQIEIGESTIIKERKFPYKLAEVNKFIKPEQAIVIETNRMGYDSLIELSKKIKSESIIESNKHISTIDIEYEAEDLSNFFSNKMYEFSEKEEFEEAENMKKNIELIKDKVNKIKKLNKTEITTKEYFKIFSL